MPMPKKRHSNVRQGKRRFSNYKLSPNAIMSCPACGAAIQSHHACPSCGSYKGRQVIKIKEPKKKGKEKE